MLLQKSEIMTTKNNSFQEAFWYLALTLPERVKQLHSSGKPEFFTDLSTGERTNFRINRWLSQAPFDKDGYFTQKLSLEGITEEQFMQLLGEPVETIKERCKVPLAWLSELEEAYESHLLKNDCVPRDDDTLPYQDISGFLTLIEPLVRRGQRRLRQNIQTLLQQYPEAPFELESVEASLSMPLLGELASIIGRTMVLELNVARLQNFLEGETPEARFHSYIKRLEQPEVVMAILQEYPVLARQVVNSIDKWVRASLEFLRHLCADWERIRKIFSPEPDPGTLKQVVCGVGDKHKDGRSVMIAHFESGFKIVYKPRSLAVDVHFQELLSWLNEHSNLPAFRTLQVLECGDHGWIEFVETMPCDSVEALQRFYERQGGYLALLYALEATDFHLENLIASGEHPILIDLESLFQPRFELTNLDLLGQIAGNALVHSVLRVGLLPQLLWANDLSEGVDLSGIGATAGQLSPDAVPNWENPGTDIMRLVRQRMKMPGADNRPTLAGQDFSVEDYTEVIVTGFTKIYQLLLQNRADLLADNGPLDWFANDEVRVILRPTRTYGKILFESYHPDVLRDALEQDRLFDHLWVAVEHNPSLIAAIPFEKTDLSNGDIPIFTTRPNSLDLWSSRGEKIENYFSETGLTLVRKRLHKLDQTDLERQVWYIRASMTTLSLSSEQMLMQPAYLQNVPEQPASPAEFLRAAVEIGDRLAFLALQQADEATWLGLVYVNEKRWSLLPMGIDLYGGVPGVALFLAYLSKVSREEKYKHLAKAAITTVLNQKDQMKSYLKAVGGFDGWGGLLYTLTHLGVLWDDLLIFQETEEIITYLPELISEDEMFDIIAGVAGCLGALLCFYHHAPSKRILSIAVQCGEHLLQNAQQLTSGVGWKTPLAKEHPLAGFSHGVAGIAWALLKLASVTEDNRYKNIALKAIEYERSLYSPDKKNWPDLRELEGVPEPENPDEPHYMTTWCHGAPGIGLSRVQMFPYLSDDKIHSEIIAAVETTKAHGFGGNHSLCHGDLGNLELLLQASDILDEPHWRDGAYGIATTVLESIKTHGWICGVPQGVETPGLMTGLAGIGYGLLRLAEPEKVPSVLVLEPPKPV